MSPVRVLRVILGILLIIIGGTFFLQGINVLPGSFMTGQTRWAVIGATMLIAGGWLILGGRQRRA